MTNLTLIQSDDNVDQVEDFLLLEPSTSGELARVKLRLAKVEKWMHILKHILNVRRRLKKIVFWAFWVGINATTGSSM